MVCTVSAAVAGLTLVSGFGLGTLLLPAFALFFPVDVAIAATAAVHLANNLFKLALVGRWAVWSVVLRFGIPAIVAALLGAGLLHLLSGTRPLTTYSVAGVEAEVTTLKLAIAALMAAFAALDLWPGSARLQFSPRLLPLGGALSGFFGGLSGMQGALRAAFLVRVGLSRDQFVGTTAVVSTGVDLVRLAVYAAGFVFLTPSHQGGWAALSDPHTAALVAAAALSAFAGSLLGSKLVRKVTLLTVQRIVGALLLGMAVLLGAGLI